MSPPLRGLYGCSRKPRRQGENRHLGARQYFVGRIFARPSVPGGRRTRHRQNHDERCNFCWKAQGRRKMPLHHAVGNRARIAGRRGLPWLVAGRWHRSIRTAAAGKPAGLRAAAEPALFVRPRTRRNDQADFRGGRARTSRAGWCSTACPRSGCWRKARCATGGRSWRSSIISRSSAPRCCCSTI